MNRRKELASIHFSSDRFQWRLGEALAIVEAAFRKTRSPKPYVAFSGGKDSIVVAALVARSRPEVPLIWSDDELEYDETIELMEYLQRAAPDNLIVFAGQSTHQWFRAWTSEPFHRAPLPHTRTSRVTNLMNEWAEGEGYNLTFLGTRTGESRKRLRWLWSAGPLYRVLGGTVRCCPIWDWSDDDVWALIAGWKLGHNRAYNRFEEIGLDSTLWRVGPLPLTPRHVLLTGWPKLLDRLERRYRRRWTDRPHR